MRIWIDGYEANVPQRVGSNQVAFELLKNLEKIDKKNEYTICLPSKPLYDLPREREGWTYKILKPSKLWTYLTLPLYIRFAKNKPDIFFSPTHYIPRVSGIKRIGTIFDLGFLRYPESFTNSDRIKLIKGTEYTVKNSDHLITISKSTKKDVQKEYGKLAPKLTVAYPGYNSEIYRVVKDKEKIEEIKLKYKIQSPYIIFVGTIQPRKNLVLLIDAIKNIENLNLVIIGKHKGEGREGWKYKDILNHPKDIGINERVIFTGFIPDEDILYLINGALAFVLPSLWEGFGIPVVDAFACGKPVVVSNVSSLPEIVGQSGLIVNPNSTSQIEQAIRIVISDKRLQNKLSKLGLKRSKLFSWRKMAKVVLKVFENVKV